MKADKYKYFRLILTDGSECEVKNHAKVTESYFIKLAYHYANKQIGLNLAQSDVVRCIGIEK